MRKYYKPGLGNKKYRNLDKWFSAYIRLRDTNEHGQGRCITCQKMKPFEDLDCGHWQTRNNISTRFDPHNANAQCRNCNSFKGGESLMHGVQIGLKFSEMARDMVEVKSHSMMKLLPFEIAELSKEYRIKARALYAVKSDWFKSEYQNLVK